MSPPPLSPLFAFLFPTFAFSSSKRKSATPTDPTDFVFVDKHVDLDCEDGRSSTDVFPCLNTAFASNICDKAKSLIDKVTELLQLASQLAENEEKEADYGIQNLFGLVLKLLSRTLLACPLLSCAFLPQAYVSHLKLSEQQPPLRLQQGRRGSTSPGNAPTSSMRG